MQALGAEARCRGWVQAQEAGIEHDKHDTSEMTHLFYRYSEIFDPILSVASKRKQVGSLG